MSITVKRSTKSFSSLVNITVQLDGITIDRLAPGESMTFELPDQEDHIKIKAYFSHKEIDVSDGDVITIVRNSRIRLFKILVHILVLISILLVPFASLIEYPAIIFIFQFCLLILYSYIYYFVPDFLLKKVSRSSTDQEI